jgi:hypothetical protein
MCQKVAYRCGQRAPRQRLDLHGACAQFGVAQRYSSESVGGQVAACWQLSGECDPPAEAAKAGQGEQSTKLGGARHRARRAGQRESRRSTTALGRGERVDMSILGT